MALQRRPAALGFDQKHSHAILISVRRQRLCVAAATRTATKATTSSATRKLSVLELQQSEQAILAALNGARGRGKEGLTPDQLSALTAAVEALEADGGVADPTTLPALDGRWRLLYTSRPGSASPIQRTFTGVEAFSIFQEVQLQQPAQGQEQEGGGEEEEEEGPRVNNVVEFGALGFLKVEAQASTERRPLPGFIPRSGEGLPLFGKSFTYPPARPNTRIDFQFDRAAFNFRFLPFKLPYPVPFRLLGDERKGWLDVTYMNVDGTFRLSRGNKGTLFVLVKDVPIKQRLAEAISRQDDELVAALVSLMEQDNPTPAPARSPLASGRWRLVWSAQAESASALQKWGSRQAESFQEIDGEAGTAANVVQLSGWATVRANARVEAASDSRTTVDITDAGLNLGPVRLPVPAGGRKGDTPGYIDWLYLDEELRITRGSKGSLFIHRREAS
ncbi:hypothetical protein PLESTB_000481200 [Pleodorina starrii]|uniref:Plastid lipid-associated protein/fibrillin conserved domain-containing protein n=1 Tax=Pleodorina starrii TaxID=330485 RepID=A0A9W6F023_9CHLO|nr:hypothetical protein PLESTM_001585300 [Pleodorina starrii]GLC51239.1 hypothetical protein PLESTB_000481200 [Pleodorina starrii]GLC63598.1 hypothetical protein PLESTF_000053600 [Pleodorina starrii]